MLGALYSTHVAHTPVESTSSLAGTLPTVVKVVIGAMAACAVLGLMAMSMLSAGDRVGTGHSIFEGFQTWEDFARGGADLENPAADPAAADPATTTGPDGGENLWMYTCDYKCGFKGLFPAVETHEFDCEKNPNRVEQRVAKDTPPQRPRKAANKKRSRADAYTQSWREIPARVQKAKEGNMPCTKLCPHADCGERIANNVSAADIHDKMTWRHKEHTNEREVAAAMCTEIRDGLGYASVAGKPCCLHAHAYFNGLWCEKENRPSKTHRKYVKSATYGSSAEAATLANDTQAQSDVCRRHAESWIQDHIVDTAQTFPVMTTDHGDVEVDSTGQVISREWEYRIRPPVIKHEHGAYEKDCVAEGLVAVKYDFFLKIWKHVTTEVLNVKIDTFNNVTADCFECVEYNNLVHKYRLAGGSKNSDRLAAQAQKAAHIEVVKTGHRGGKDIFAARSRNPDSGWLAIEFDGIDNSHTHVSLGAQYLITYMYATFASVAAKHSRSLTVVCAM